MALYQITCFYGKFLHNLPFERRERDRSRGHIIQSFYNHLQIATADAISESYQRHDSDNEQKLYNILNELGVAYISVGHREEIKQFHNLVLTMLPNGKYSLDTK